MSIKRDGFTLIELLIVVALIALLASVTLLVIGDSTDQARVAATETTIRKVNKFLEERVAAFDRSIERQLPALGIQVQQASKTAFGFPAPAIANPNLKLLRDRVAEIIAYKIEFRNNFPQRFLDVRNPVTNNPLDAVDSQLSAAAGPNGIPDIIDRLIADPNLNVTAATMGNHDPVTESSELLYYMLTHGNVYGVPPVGSDQFSASEVQDTDGDGLMEFVDNWGNPLRFYRWPTRLIDPAYTPSPALTYETDDTRRTRGITGTARSLVSLLVKGLPPDPTVISIATVRDPLMIDPDDKIGRIYFELQRLNGAAGIPDLSLYFREELFHTPDTWHTPLIVSAGGDGVLGLYEPNWVDGDSNANGSADAWDINLNGTTTAPGEYNEREDPDQDPGTVGVYGNLAFPNIRGVDPFGDTIATSYSAIDLTPKDVDVLTDNISNRNRRVGGN